MGKSSKKLVRDNIPDIIKNSGKKPITRVLSDDEYKTELYKKLLEESNEVIEAKNSDETVKELADVLEVVRTIAELNDKRLEDIIEIANQKKIIRGGFEKRIFLEEIKK